MARKGNSGTFGVGRRPTGRPKGAVNKVTAELKALAQVYTPEAVDALVAILRDGKNEQARIAAARELLDRAHGKPAQMVQHDGVAMRALVVDLLQPGEGLKADDGD